jgi:hypothetical protein
MRGRGARWTHLPQHDPQAAARDLPRRLAAGKTAANYLDRFATHSIMLACAANLYREPVSFAASACDVKQ